jgi:hypothetical protein
MVTVVPSVTGLDEAAGVLEEASGAPLLLASSAMTTQGSAKKVTVTIAFLNQSFRNSRILSVLLKPVRPDAISAAVSCFIIFSLLKFKITERPSTETGPEY